ncbi:MAG: UvrD-helicase domain-containing protein, partial [Candidatus Hydrogenedentes bacterium]|nr:UvrD-helicase domain-containing protein [Candidatus Hydrogenedentota bacterium]
VIYAPDFEHVERLTASLARIGNLAADGRPILGLDSRDLLEIVLESGPGAYLVPAHIWTPWFSALGSKSGFDSIEDCYRDLARHVFAVETGLSSDPPMNWRLSSLDRYRLVSNSDAHSPPNLGRNACVFDCAPDYFAMRHALETGAQYAGTVEFYPEKGKYHLDGHRKCGVRLAPADTRARNGVCPACGKPLTIGVMYRVEELADRPEGGRRTHVDPFRSLIPLPEILSELEGVGPGSKRIGRIYEQILARFGPELPFLEHTPIDEIERHASPVLAESIRRMRAGRVIREAGFDGEFGFIRLFTPEELESEPSTGLLFPLESSPAPCPPAQDAPAAPAAAEPGPAPYGGPQAAPSPRRPASADPLLDGLDAGQQAAVTYEGGPLLIVAGPGTGKTRTITHRLAYAIHRRGVAPEACLAVTFTRRAAGEMAERLHRLAPDAADAVRIRTFHGLGLEMLRDQTECLGLPADFAVAGDAERHALLARTLGVSERSAARRLRRIAEMKRTGVAPEADTEDGMALAAYDKALRANGLLDFEDLLKLPVELLEQHEDLVADYRHRFPWICIDEYQDINALQYRLVRLLAPDDGNLTAIGDPDQAIYGFRGADVALFRRFEQDYPAARVIGLMHSYRCPRTILDASGQVITEGRPEERRLEALLDTPDRVIIHDAPTDKAEAEFVVHTTEQIIGGHSFFSLDSGRSEGQDGVELAFSDIAVLYRTDAQAGPLAEALARSGIPFQRRSHRALSDEPTARQLAALLRADGGDGPVHARLHAAAERLLQAADAAPERLGPDWQFHESGPADAPERDGGLATQVAAALALLEPLAVQCGGDCARFLDELALGAELDSWDPRADRVSLLTLHAAKGLEFDVVFIVGCEEGLLPLSWGGRLPREAAEEERRLFYVGMTRAKRRLILSHARKRLWRGQVRPTGPSPFLQEIAERLLDRRTGTGPRRRSKPSASQLDLF